MIKNWKLEIGNWKFRPKNGRLGFTLIELLIVVAIIAVLSTLLMVNFIGVRQRARDAERKSSVKQIQAGLEIYKADQGEYPPEPIGNCGTGGVSMGSPTCSIIYMKKIPKDPSGDEYEFNAGEFDYDRIDEDNYDLVACLENTADQDQSICSTAGESDFPVCSAGLSGCTSEHYYVLQNP